MRHWAVVIPAEEYEQERLVGADFLAAPGVDRVAGDRVAMVAATEPPVVFGLGLVARDGRIRYTGRLFEEPLPTDGVVAGPLTEEAFAALVAKAGPAAPVRTW